MTLINVRIGAVYSVKAMKLDIKIRRRLEALGLTIGTNIKILNRNRSGSVILMVRGSRLALGSRIAEKINIGEVSV